MSMIAIPWYFAQKNMLAYFGMVFLFTNVLTMFWSPLSGAIIDKFDRKKIFLALTLVIGSILTVISLSGFNMGELPPMIVASVFILTFLNYNVHYPCLYAFVQEISEKHLYSKLSSLLEIIGQTTTILAGAGATLLLEGTTNGQFHIFGFNFNIGRDIRTWDIHEIFMLDGITYFVAFLVISLIRYTPLVKRKTEVGSLFQRFKVGYNYLKANKSIFWFGVLSFNVFLALILEAFYMGVSYVNNHLQESGDVYANSKMAYSIGALSVGFLIRFLFKKINIPLSIILMTCIAGCVFLTLATSHSIWLFFLMMLSIGIVNAGVRIARMTYLFKNVPNQYFGRVGSVLFIVNVILRICLLSIFTLAFFQEGNNIIYTYYIISAILFTTTGLLIFHYKSFDLSLIKTTDHK